jgi:tRNA modification GTPase
MRSKFLCVSLRGAYQYVFLQIESELVWCLAHIEASIDFSTEGLDVVDQNVLIQKLQTLSKQLQDHRKKLSSRKNY